MINKSIFLKWALILMLTGRLFGQLTQPMEFLVRLTDKVNTQVFCLAPVHVGLPQDRVFYKDDTFEAPCPKCGGTEWLYRKNNAISKRGHFITFKPAGWSWGTNERKHFGIVRINCTLEQAKAWCDGIRNERAEQDIEKYKTIGDEESLKLAENRAKIDKRPRKFWLDFEQILTVDELKNWNNREKNSTIITITPDKFSSIKESMEIQ